MAENRQMSNRLMRDFIELYRQHECLWKIRSPAYGNKNARIEAYDKLVKLIRPFFPNADKEFVIKKINTIRGCFRKELKKMNDSIRSGSDSVHKPQLWYFDLLLFTRDQETPRNSLSTLDVLTTSENDETQDRISGENLEDGEEPPVVKEEIIPTSDEETWNEQCTALPLNQLQPQSSKRKRCKTSETQFDKLLDVLHSQTEKREARDSCTVFGEHIANKLRNYDLLTRANVEYKINCVLHEADLQVLQGKMNHLRNGL